MGSPLQPAWGGRRVKSASDAVVFQCVISFIPGMPLPRTFVFLFPSLSVPEFHFIHCRLSSTTASILSQTSLPSPAFFFSIHVSSLRLQFSFWLPFSPFRHFHCSFLLATTTLNNPTFLFSTLNMGHIQSRPVEPDPINPGPDDLEYNAMSFVEKVSYLTNRAYTTHAFYVCDSCYKMHRVPTDFIPKIRTHMEVCEVVSKVGYSYFSTDIPPMEMPCQRGEYADTPESIHRAGHYANHFIPLSAHSFTGTLSHGRRAPLSGYCHRDIESVHKLHRTWQAPTPENACAEDPEVLEYRELCHQFRTALSPHGIKRHLKRMVNGRPQNVTVEYIFEPRIVKVGKGENKKHHFMVETTVKFAMEHKNFVPLALCPHQLLNYKTRGLSEEQIRAYNIDAESSPAAWQRGLQSTKEWLKEIDASHRVPLGPFSLQIAFDKIAEWLDEDAIKESDSLFVMSNKRTTDDRINYAYPNISCPRCHTDFNIVALRKANKMQITAWQDFGPGGLITDSHWQAHIPGNMLPLTEDETQASNNNNEPTADTNASTISDVASISCTPTASRSPSPSPSNTSDNSDNSDNSTNSADSEDSDIVVVGNYLTEARKTGLQPYRRKKEKKEDTEKKVSAPAVEKTVCINKPNPTPIPTPAPNNTKVNNWKTGLTVRHVPGSVRKAFFEDACIVE